MRAIAICSLMFLALSATAAGRPSEADHPELRVMKHYAPILWRADDEPLVPTLPHPFAFDGIAPDLEDPNEISWDFDVPLKPLVERVSKYQEKHRLQARVLYYPPSLVREVDDPPDNFIYVLEYWFYYLYDRGVGAHKGDSEHAFIFVAINHRLDEAHPCYDDLIEGKVVGVVGAGHSTHTANNVLVAGRNKNPYNAVFPDELPQHIAILVERGKHGSAPDRDFNGQFDIGADANIFRDGGWGSRDVRANSAGRLVGPFKSWYSFPRNENRLLIERSAFEHFAAPIESTDGGSAAPGPPLYDGYNESFPRLFPKNSPPLLQSSEENKYDLFPMTDLEELYAMLGDPTASDEQSAREVSAFLQEHRDCFWLHNAPARVSIDPHGAIQQMRRWPHEDEYHYDAAQHVKLFKHSDHVRPDNIFKLNLYPTIAPGLRYTQDGTSGSLGEFTVRFADIADKVFTNSMLELNTAWDLKTGNFYDFNVHYYFFRGSYSGIYAGLGVRQERLSATSDMTADQRHEIFQQVGAEPPMVGASTRQRYGVDVGWAFTFNLRNHLFFDFKAGVRGDLFDARPTDFEIARGAQDKFRFVFGVAIRHGFFHPRHPLSY